MTQLPDQSRWVILDREWFGYCTLDDGLGNLLPLEWRNRAGAEAWLMSCRRRWALVGGPNDWQAPPPEPSPWV